MSETIKKLTIEGFKSIRKLDDFELRSLNVLIGANGAGKSNFVEFFRLLREIIDGKLQLAVGRAGGVDVFLHFGPKYTSRIVAKLYFSEAGYEFKLVPTEDNRLIFAEEMVLYDWKNERRKSLGAGHAETRLKDFADHGLLPLHVVEAASSWIVYHFHDTSATAGVRREKQINDNMYLRPDAENLAAFLYRVRKVEPPIYAMIRDVVRLAAPFFDDFELRPVPTNPELIRLEWLQEGSDRPFLTSQLSDGTLRFICLATALLQPSPPSTMLFDEPELGLHPYALTLLANLFQQAAQLGRQVIVSTQSAQLLNEFAPEDVIVVERSQGESVFQRLNSTQLSGWLEDYTLGELWQKNVLGGGPRNEKMPLPSNGDEHASVAPHKEEASAGDERS
ncbi:MAG TPA: AAA family ATPase [Terriglobia bacterium]|nr:AAA family ATPase [Terriglobia bacterium]